MFKRFEKYALVPPLLTGAVLFLLGITWGLPSKKADAFLFGDRTPWTGEQIVQLLGQRESLAAMGGAIGSDVDANPISRGQRPIVINDTDAKRAEIISRYRLYSYQPDEMITFRALRNIPKSHGDPGLYQYGGLWIYPVGVLIRIAGVLNLVDIRDLAFYLDHPEAFARFYIIARLYVVAWAMVGVWAVFWIAQKISGQRFLAMLAAGAYVQLPAVLNMAHEAKPHLPGAVLMLLAVIAAIKYVETDARKWALIAGVLCGAAFGMVLTGLFSFVILPFMALHRNRGAMGERILTLRNAARHQLPTLLLALACAIATYCVTNPFVLIHWFGDRTVLESNLRNSMAMYTAPLTREGLLNAIYLIGEGASPILAGMGAIAALFMRRRRAPELLLAILCLPTLVQFVNLATGKPGEYARFGLLLYIALAIAAFSLAARMKRGWFRAGWLALLCITPPIWTTGYLWHFERDAVQRTPRMIIAERLQQTYQRGAREISIYADPAPYNMPPINLFDWKIVLLDPGAAPPSTSDVLIKPIDIVPHSDAPMRGYRIVYWVRPRILDAPISWASKPFRVIVRSEFVPSEPAR
jgi:hypothetical protein